MSGKLRSISNASPVRGAGTLALGDLTITLSDGCVKALNFRGIELLRGLAYPIRDADWGTVATSTGDERLSADELSASYVRDFSSEGGGFSGRFTLQANAAGRVIVEMDLVARRRQNICRAGFTLLHPILSLAGRPLTVLHSDGAIEKTTFPLLISPSQPARDITGLRYTIDDSNVAIDMRGEVFEMEDQRNWSDASYKTYCRPLSRPFPYEVSKDERIHQHLEISIRGGKAAQAKLPRSSPALRMRREPLPEDFPGIAIVSEAGWDHDLLGGLDRLPRIVRIDLRRANPPVPDCWQAPIDLELITANALDTAAAQLQAFANVLASANISPEHVIALPAAYLKSHQPDGAWPTGATPGEIVSAARAAFPNARIGGGMLTNFAELNRSRPDPTQLDYLTHGTSAIVHAADDASIFQTIEALPQIFASARSIAPGIPYRLGLVSIGMRTNPYGSGLADNPEGRPRTMTADDPRSRSITGAAWVVAAIGATEGFAIEIIALGSPAGPFGVVDADTGDLRPTFHVIRGLKAMAGLPRIKVETGDPMIHAVAALSDNISHVIMANGCPIEKQVNLQGGVAGTILDQTTAAETAAIPTWIEDTLRPVGSELRLPPYSVAFLSIPRSAEPAQ